MINFHNSQKHFKYNLNPEFKSLFLPRVAEFIYIEGDNKRVYSAGIIHFICPLHQSITIDSQELIVID